jgi:zinc-binding alcohol dehydrogenase family protein
MKAIGINQFLPTSHPDCFTEFHLDLPQLNPRDLLIQVKAIGVNPIDCKIRSTIKDKLIQPKVLGWDCSGTVIQVGSEVCLFKPGDQVYYAGSITRSGCNSEYHTVDERIVGYKPKSLSFAEAAALPLTTITAWEALFEQLLIIPRPVLNTNRSILIIGGAGGVGSIAIQLAKKVAGLTVIATASRAESQDWCLRMGVDYVINHHQDFSQQLTKIGVKEVDYILCLNSIDRYWEIMAELIKPFGKLCAVVSANSSLNLNLIKNKSVTFAWEFMFTKSMYQTSNMESQGNLLNEVAKLLDEGILCSTMRKDLGLLNRHNLAMAHQIIESGQAIGKVVINNG